MNKISLEINHRHFWFQYIWSSNFYPHFVLGAITAVFLVANIAGSLIAVVAFIAFVNGILSWFGGLVGIAELSIELIFGYVFIPLAWLMGVDYEV